MKALLFDMDGVLVDVSCSYRLAIKKTIEIFLGRMIELDLIQEYKNRGGFNNDWDLTEKILKDYGEIIEKETVIRAFQDIYLGKNYDGLIQNEKWLLERKILDEMVKSFQLGIVTGRPNREACYTLSRFGVKNRFSVLVTMDDVPVDRSKPDSFGIQLAMREMRSKKTYYFGDNVDDMEAAQRANVVPIGVVIEAWGYEKQKNKLLNHGAQQVLKNINDIWEVLR